MKKFVLAIAVSFVSFVASSQMQAQCIILPKLDSFFVSHNIHFMEMADRLIMDKYLNKNYKIKSKDYEQILIKSYNEFLLWDNDTHDFIPDTTKIYMSLNEYVNSRIDMSEKIHNLNNWLADKSIDVNIMQMFHIDVNANGYEFFEILECVCIDQLNNTKLLKTYIFAKGVNGWEDYCSDDLMH